SRSHIHTHTHTHTPHTYTPCNPHVRRCHTHKHKQCTTHFTRCHTHRHTHTHLSPMKDPPLQSTYHTYPITGSHESTHTVVHPFLSASLTHSIFQSSQGYTHTHTHTHT